MADDGAHKTLAVRAQRAVMREGVVGVIMVASARGADAVARTHRHRGMSARVARVALCGARI